MGYVKIDETGQPEYFNLIDRTDTPFYRFPTTDKQTFLKEINTKENFFIVDKKILYKFLKNKSLRKNIIDVEACLWKNDVDFIPVKHDDYKTIPLVYYFDKIKEFRDLIVSNKLQDEVLNHYFDLMIYATAQLETGLRIDNITKNTEYNFFTASGRFREVNYNAIGLKKEEREKIKINGLKIALDLDGAHLRILDAISGGEGLLPPNTRAVQHLIDTSENTLDKKKIYTMLYSESFVNSDHPFFQKIKRKYKTFKSPLERKHKNFNYIIQEYEAILISSLIYHLSSSRIRFVLYLYDGLLIELQPDAFKEFVDKCKEIAYFPFKLEILDKKYFIYKNTSNDMKWEELKKQAKEQGKVRIVQSQLIQEHETKEEDVNKTTSETENLTNH